MIDIERLSRDEKLELLERIWASPTATPFTSVHLSHLQYQYRYEQSRGCILR